MRSKPQFVIAGLFATALLMALALPAQAREVTIAWLDTQNPDIIGFRVYTGASLASMTQNGPDLSVGALTHDPNGDWTTKTNVSDTEIELLVLTAFAADGFESGYSNSKRYNDDDGDGVANADDAFPNDPSRWEEESTEPPTEPPPTAVQAQYRINAGGGAYSDPDGNSWQSDAGYFNVGETATRPAGINGTNLGPLYETERWDYAGGEEMTYSFPVDPGTYVVRLHLAERWSEVTQPGMRVFSVQVENQIVLQDYDVFAAAGFNTAVVEEFSAQVTDGSLDIEFLHGVQNPAVFAIEVLSETALPAGGLTVGKPGRPTLIAN